MARAAPSFLGHDGANEWKPDGDAPAMEVDCRGCREGAVLGANAVLGAHAEAGISDVGANVILGDCASVATNRGADEGVGIEGSAPTGEDVGGPIFPSPDDFCGLTTWQFRPVGDERLRIPAKAKLRMEQLKGAKPTVEEVKEVKVADSVSSSPFDEIIPRRKIPNEQVYPDKVKNWLNGELRIADPLNLGTFTAKSQEERAVDSLFVSTRKAKSAAMPTAAKKKNKNKNEKEMAVVRSPRTSPTAREKKKREIFEFLSSTSLKMEESGERIEGAQYVEEGDGAAGVKTEERGEGIEGVKTVEEGDGVAGMKTMEKGDGVADMKTEEIGEEIECVKTEESVEGIEGVKTVEEGNGVAGVKTDSHSTSPHPPPRSLEWQMAETAESTHEEDREVVKFTESLRLDEADEWDEPEEQEVSLSHSSPTDPVIDDGCIRGQPRISINPASIVMRDQSSTIYSVAPSVSGIDAADDDAEWDELDDVAGPNNLRGGSVDLMIDKAMQVPSVIRSPVRNTPPKSPKRAGPYPYQRRLRLQLSPPALPESHVVRLPAAMIRRFH